MHNYHITGTVLLNRKAVKVDCANAYAKDVNTCLANGRQALEQAARAMGALKRGDKLPVGLERGLVYTPKS